jgi:hypothetical protein
MIQCSLLSAQPVANWGKPLLLVSAFSLAYGDLAISSLSVTLVCDRKSHLSMVASAAERGILELRRITYDSPYPIFVRRNPSSEVIFLGPHFNVRSRFLGSDSFPEAFLNNFCEIISHAHYMLTSSDVFVFFVILLMRDSKNGFVGSHKKVRCSWSERGRSHVSRGLRF